MKSIEIKADLRKETGKKSTIELRSRGDIPCVMYGGDNNVHFTAKMNDLRHIIYTHHIYLIKLDISGKQHQAILKDIQFHPVTDEPLHIDFIEVSDSKPATVSLPITLNGSSVGLKAGGKLRQRRRYLKVRGLISNLPEMLSIDITDLNIGDYLKVSDLSYPDLELLDPSRAMVVGVSTSRIAKGMEEGVPEAALSAEEVEEEEDKEEQAKAAEETAEE